MRTKYCLATCLCLLLSFLLHAQLRVGVKGGLNLNQPIGKEKGKNSPSPSIKISRYDLHTDFHAGLTADIRVTKKFHIRPDLLFSRRTAQYETGNPAGSMFYEETLRADLLEVPVHFVYYHQMKHLALYIGGGPYVGYALSGKATHRGGRRQSSEFGEQLTVYFTQEEDWYRKTSFGAVLAAGIDLPFGLTGELSVHRAFNDMNNSHMVNNHTKLFNFNYGISVGYLFGKKRS